MAEIKGTRTPRTVKNPRKDRPPRYVSLRPQYQSFRSFMIASGSHDTLMNMVELALRFFEHKMIESRDCPSFVKEMCETFKINSSLDVDWTDVRRNAHLLSITQVISVIDDFVRPSRLNTACTMGYHQSAGSIQRTENNSIL